MANNNNGGEGTTLVATYPILYLAHQYKVGDVLPANNASMVNAWLEAGTAKWINETEPVQEPPKGKLTVAEPGLPEANVVSNSPSHDNLVGKVPKTSRRKKE